MNFVDILKTFAHQIAITVNLWKMSKYGVFFGQYFPLYGLNTEIFGVNLRIQSEYGKIRTRKNHVFANFSRSEYISKTSRKSSQRRIQNPVKYLRWSFLWEKQPAKFGSIFVGRKNVGDGLKSLSRHYFIRGQWDFMWRPLVFSPAAGKLRDAKPFQWNKCN